MDALWLSRLQFGLTVSFHYIFPPLSIGLGAMLVLMEGTYLKTKNKLYLNMAQFWVRIYALIFSIGVATGIVMEFEFGTNWARYSRYVGDIFGSALAAEGIFAFFLESGFLALLIFGWNRIGPKMHFFSTCMVALGSTFSAVWIIVADSWMQTPGKEGTSYHIVTTPSGQIRAEVVNFWALVFSPSSVDRLWHTVMAAWQTGAWLVLSVCAYYLIKKRHEEFAKAGMKIALVLAMIASVLQLVSGHDSAKGVAANQPAKMAAFEGHYPASEPAGMFLIGWVNEGDEKAYGLQIPGMLSFLIHGDSHAPVTGLNAFKPEDRPPVQTVFQTYHAMVGIGMLLIAFSALGCFLWWRGTLFSHPIMLRIFAWGVVLPELANQMGWFSAEIGRQPWIVYGLMRTSEGLSKTVKAGEVLTSVIMFGLVYVALGALFIFLLNHKIKHGPEDHTVDVPPTHPLHFLQGDRASA